MTTKRSITSWGCKSALQHMGTRLATWRAWREQQGAACKPDSACGANSSHVQPCRCCVHFSLSPCITAIAEQQAILTVTPATHLTERWIILSISTLSFRVLNWNLNRTGIHSLCRMWHFLKSIITLTVVPAAKSRSERTKMAVTHQNLHLVHSVHLGHDEMPDNIYLSCLQTPMTIQNCILRIGKTKIKKPN